MLLPVHHVPTDVLPVKVILTTVPHVPESEPQLVNVLAHMEPRNTVMEPVNHVPTNVSIVVTMLKTVLHVLLTESTLHLVPVHQDTTKITLTLTVHHVIILVENVTLNIVLLAVETE
jgi:hypothetical protein